MPSSMDVASTQAVAALEPTVRPSTEQDMVIALQRPMFHKDPVVEMTYNLGGAVAIDHEGQVFRAPDDRVVAALGKAAKLRLVAQMSVQEWFKARVGKPSMIQAVAQSLIEADQCSGGFLDACGNKAENVNMVPSDAETACDILDDLLRDHDEYEKVLVENSIFRKHRKVQLDWKHHRVQSTQLEKEREQLLLRHTREDMCQKRESQLRLQQLMRQEKLLQERLDQEKHGLREIELHGLERKREAQEKVGQRLQQRGQIIHADLRLLPERSETRPQHQKKAFLKAFLTRMKQNCQDAQVAAAGAKGEPERDSTGTTNGPSPSSPLSPQSQGFFFRSDSGVDDESMVGKGDATAGCIKAKDELTEEQDMVFSNWIWHKK